MSIARPDDHRPRVSAVPTVDAKGTVLLDFNQVYNPPCAFTPFATCPLPPPENRLDLAIEAGERDYRKPKPATPNPPTQG